MGRGHPLFLKENVVPPPQTPPSPRKEQTRGGQARFQCRGMQVRTSTPTGMIACLFSCDTLCSHSLKMPLPRESQRVDVNMANSREEMSESFFFSLLFPVKVTSVDFKGEGSPKIGDSRRGDRAAGGKESVGKEKRQRNDCCLSKKLPCRPPLCPRR